MFFKGDCPKSLVPLLDKYGVRQVSDVSSGPYFQWHPKKEYLVYKTEADAPDIAFDFKKYFADLKRQGLGPKKHLLSRALGMDKAPNLVIFDGTLGFGKDTGLLLFLGARVWASEKNPVPALLTEAGLQPFIGSHFLPPGHGLQVWLGDSADNLKGLASPPDALYLDPMFEGITGKALPKKNMAFLRTGESHAFDSSKIFEVARGLGIPRIVVKRALKAEALVGKPSFDIPGKMIRYDVYRDFY